MDIVNAPVLQENQGISFIGIQTLGAFDISEELAHQWMTNTPALIGYEYKVLRPYVNAQDMVRRSRNRWVIDFGSEMDESEAALYEEPSIYNITYDPFASSEGRKRPKIDCGFIGEPEGN